jgi:hypothetical protein
VKPFISKGKDRRNRGNASSGERAYERGKREITTRAKPGSRHSRGRRYLQTSLFFVLVDVDDLSRLVYFDRDLSAGGNIPEHAALGFEFEILLPS